MKYKLLALDLDGTLTNSDKRISDKNKECIKRAQDKGVKVVLASGRPVLGIQPLADELMLSYTGGYILAYNGGQIIDCLTKKNILLRTIPMKYYHDICACGQKFNVSPLTYNNIGVLSESATNPYVIKEAFNNSIPIVKVNSLEQIIEAPVVKFMVVGEPIELKKAYNYLSEKLDGNLNVFFSEPYFLEITSLGIEKASSLDKLLKYLELTQENLVACGDGLNDIPMLKFAGLSIAMANAYDETKKWADFISVSNDDDGVALAISKFILNGDQL